MTSFKLTRLQIEIEPIEELHLPLYPANTFRGGLGYVLKDMLCEKGRKECVKQCQNSSDCSYAQLFEQIPGVKDQNGEYIPYIRPYLIQTGRNLKRVYRKGETYTFFIHLFGDWVSKFHYFIAALKTLGEIGFGKQKENFRLTRVLSEKNHWIKNVVYDGKQDVIKHSPLEVTYEEIKQQVSGINAEELKLNFFSPTYIQIEGQSVEDFHFHEMIDNMIRKYRSLMLFHHHVETNKEDFEDLLEAAIDVEKISSSVSWKSYDRYSTRQQRDIFLNGVIGEMKFKGDVTPFLPILFLGSYIHLGKNSAFGLGQYKILIV
jgi:CRISPR-associated endoribonuclease Cas6